LDQLQLILSFVFRKTKKWNYQIIIHGLLRLSLYSASPIKTRI